MVVRVVIKTWPRPERRWSPQPQKGPGRGKGISDENNRKQIFKPPGGHSKSLWGMCQRTKAKLRGLFRICEKNCSPFLDEIIQDTRTLKKISFICVI